MILGLYAFAQLSDRSGNLRRYTALPLVCFAACFLLSTLFKDQIWVSFDFLVACRLFMQFASGIFWTIPPMLYPTEVAGGLRGSNSKFRTKAPYIQVNQTFLNTPLKNRQK
jgi:MFS family permease